MTQLQNWALEVCLVCAGAGLLNHLAGSQGRKSVIKLTLTLYILVTALSPLKSGLASEEIDWQTPRLAAQPSPDAGALALARAESALSEELSAKVGAGVRVTLERQGQEVAVARITVSGAADSRRVEAQLREDFGDGVEIVCESGGGNGE